MINFVAIRIETIMKAIIDFLRRLQANNNREWFQAHKDEFLKHQARFHVLVEEVIREITMFDPDMAGLTPKDCTYRIYRDVRFSADKSPYKCHFGAFITKGGKKSGNAGYYFHISTGGSDEYPYCHLLASGDYCYQPEVMKILREDIVNGEGDFDRVVKMADASFALEKEGALKRNPKGFPADAPYPEYLRLKYFCLTAMPGDEFWEGEDLAKRIAAKFATTKPFLDYINRAIGFSREEKS